MALNYKTGKAARPISRKSLTVQIQTLFGRALSPEEVEATIERLIADKVITVSDKDEIGYPTNPVESFTLTKANAPLLASGKTKKPLKPKAPAPASMEHFTHVLKHLRERPKNRPTKKSALTRHLHTVLGNQIAEADVVGIVQELVRTKRLTIEADDKVTYYL